MVWIKQARPKRYGAPIRYNIKSVMRTKAACAVLAASGMLLGCAPDHEASDYQNIFLYQQDAEPHEAAHFAQSWTMFLAKYPKSSRKEEVRRYLDDHTLMASAESIPWKFGEDPVPKRDAYRTYLAEFPHGLHSQQAKASIEGAVGPYFIRLFFKALEESPTSQYLQLAERGYIYGDYMYPQKEKLYRIGIKKGFFIEVPVEKYVDIALGAGRLAVLPNGPKCTARIDVRSEEKVLASGDYVPWGQVERRRVTLHVTYRENGIERWSGTGVGEDPPLPQNLIVKTDSNGSMQIIGYFKANREACLNAGKALAKGIGQERTPLKPRESLSKAEKEFYLQCSNMVTDYESFSAYRDAVHKARHAMREMTPGPVVEDLRRALKWGGIK